MPLVKVGSRRGQGGVKEGSRRGPGRVQEGSSPGGVREGSGRGQGGVQEGSRRGLGGVWEGSGRGLEGVWEGSSALSLSLSALSLSLSALSLWLYMTVDGSYSYIIVSYIQSYTDILLLDFDADVLLVVRPTSYEEHVKWLNYLLKQTLMAKGMAWDLQFMFQHGKLMSNDELKVR